MGFKSVNYSGAGHKAGPFVGPLNYGPYFTGDREANHNSDNLSSALCVPRVAFKFGGIVFP